LYFAGPGAEKNAVPEGYNFLAPGCYVALSSIWLHKILSTIGKARAKKEKKVHKKGV
jgi:hypothetical protein